MALAGRPEASAKSLHKQPWAEVWVFVSGEGPVKGPWMRAMQEWSAQRLSHTAVLAKESELALAIGGRLDVSNGDVYTVIAK